MFLYQKLQYLYKHISTKEEIDVFLQDFKLDDHMCFDTETDGLNIITAKPFLVAFGYSNKVITFDFNKELVEYLLQQLKLSSTSLGLGAHNCKFDYHMFENGGVKIPEHIKLFDSITIARLTEYADLRESASLANLGAKYVDENAKFAGSVIQKKIININKEKRDHLREKIMENFPDDEYFSITQAGNRRGTAKLTNLVSSYEKDRVMFVNDNDPKFKFIEEHYSPATYKDVYKKDPDLMRSYAADDVVIMIEYLKKSVPVLKEVDKDLQVLRREGKLIRIAAAMEKVGLKVDLDYMLKCREEIIKYRELLYFELFMMVDVEFSVGQHELIKKLLETKYGVISERCDEKALKYIQKKGNGEVVDFVSNILELRTIDKWLTTYIDGKLNQVINGRIHTDMNNNGAISGRISCDMQQQPRSPLYDGKKLKKINQKLKDNIYEPYSEEHTKDLKKAELFHPRAMFIADEGYSLYFIDMSQMELRIQAYYTILTASEPDINLCRAYMPYLCTSGEGIDFNYSDVNLLKHFDNLTWYKKENNEKWTPTDLHNQTTHHAFPELKVGSAEFKKHRDLGKTCNFLKIYQGGIGALMDALNIDRETANKLDQAFYKAFPRIREYQDWVNKQATVYGYVENLYGRRYYMKDSQWFYKLCNYLIQGTCADMMKTFEIKIDKHLKENHYKSKMVLPVHDEIIFLIANGEEHIVPDLKNIMEDTYDVVKNIPMVAEVEYSKTNWRDKKEL